MHEDTKKVRTGGKVVGEVGIPVYDTVDELIGAEEESRIIAMFNNGNAVRIMGNERAKHTMAKVGKQRRFEIGYNLLREVFESEELGDIIGNIEKLKGAIASEKMQTAIDAYIADQKAEVESTEEVA